ncbi:MAG: GNAT family N-acetyltransferase [Candidatus Heimdallarchaeota archaeon]
MIKIRPFMKGDEEAYVMVHNKGYSTEAWYGSLEKVLKVEDFSELSYDLTFLAEVNGGIVGLIDIKVRDKIGDIENLVVLPKYRGKGIGKALLEKAIEFLKDEVEKIRVETPIQSKNAIKFYFKNGFKHITNAYLIESQNKSKLKPYLGRSFYFVGDRRYWIPDNKQMELLKKLKADFSIIGEFKVMIKTI